MFHTINLRHEIEIAAPTERVYCVIADVTRIGELSPECIRCVWTQGTPGEIAARFVGSNYVRTPETGQEWRWEMESEVIVAEFPSAFGWTVLTESWDRETSVWVFTFEADTRPNVSRRTERLHGSATISTRPWDALDSRPTQGDRRNRESVVLKWHRSDMGPQCCSAAKMGHSTGRGSCDTVVTSSESRSE
jgi:hypothetical protein